MDDVEQQYLFIAKIIQDSILAEWRIAFVNAEVLEGRISVQSNYFSCDNPEPSDFVFGKDVVGSYQATKIFKKLQDLTRQNGKPTWNRAKFTLYPDGKFDIDFSWDQEIVDKIDRLAKEPDSRFDR